MIIKSALYVAIFVAIAKAIRFDKNDFFLFTLHSEDITSPSESPRLFFNFSFYLDDNMKHGIKDFEMVIRVKDKKYFLEKSAFHCEPIDFIFTPYTNQMLEFYAKSQKEPDDCQSKFLDFVYEQTEITKGMLDQASIETYTEYKEDLLEKIINKKSKREESDRTFMCSVKIDERVKGPFEYQLKLGNEIIIENKFTSNVMNKKSDLKMVVVSEIDINDKYESLMKKINDDVDVITFVNGFGNRFTDFGSMKGWYLLKSLSSVLMTKPMILMLSIDNLLNISNFDKRLRNNNVDDYPEVESFVLSNTVFLNYNFNFAVLEYDNKIYSEEIEKHVNKMQELSEKIREQYKDHRMILFIDQSPINRILVNKEIITINQFGWWKKYFDRIIVWMQKNFDEVIAGGVRGLRSFQTKTNNLNHRYILFGNSKITFKDYKFFNFKESFQYVNELPFRSVVDKDETYGNFEMDFKIENYKNEDVVFYLELGISPLEQITEPLGKLSEVDIRLKFYDSYLDKVTESVAIVRSSKSDQKYQSEPKAEKVNNFTKRISTFPRHPDRLGRLNQLEGRENI